MSAAIAIVKLIGRCEARGSARVKPLKEAAWNSVAEDPMYLPKHNEVTDRQLLHGVIRARPFATWVTLDEGGIVANHLPFLLEARGERGTLVGHVARANPVWRSTGTPSLVMFQGAQGYITPSWYAAKAEHGKVVPTWNYVVVHARGAARAIEDLDWLRRHVSRLVDVHEAVEAAPWKVSDAPGDYIEGHAEGDRRDRDSDRRPRRQVESEPEPLAR